MKLRVLVLLAAFSIVAQNLAQSAEGPSSPVFVVRTANGESLNGPLERLDADWSVQVGGIKQVRVIGSDVLYLRRQGTPLPELPVEEQLLLANGDRVPGAVGKLAGDRLQFLARAGKNQEWAVPLAAVSVVWLGRPESDGQSSALLRRLAVESRRRDVVLFNNGDRLEGTLTALDANADKPSLQIEKDKKETTVELAKVAAVALSTDLAQKPQVKGLHGRLVLAGGARLTLASAQVDNGSLHGKTPLGHDVRVPLKEVVALDYRQGRAVPLSGLKPRAYEFTPYLGSVRWPFVVDGSVAGNELRVAGSVCDHGLGLHSGSRISFDLAGKYERFEALVGLDDATGRAGHVQLQVLVDGKAQDLAKSAELTWRGGPRPIRVNLAGAKELTLVVEHGHHGDVQDHVNWVDAWLIKQ